MLIANARVALSASASVRNNIEIGGDRVFFAGAAAPGACVDLRGYLLLPGLINAHDHLEFNLFPRLGRRIYSNASEWASDIHRPGVSPVREHLSISKRTRLLWGGLRNLLSGVTTVAHHNPYDASVFDNGFPVRVVRDFGWAHSLAFSPDAAARYRETPPDRPFIIHAGEGTDDCARAEVGRLDRLGILGSRTVIVHGVALDEASVELIRLRRASVVWCPSSNLLTYGRTLQHDRLDAGTQVALGTDSAISAAGDLIDELRIARDECGATPDSLYSMITDQAAQILRLNSCAGAIRHGCVADFIAVEDCGQSPAEALLNLSPELVFVGGRLHLISARLRDRFEPDATTGFHTIALEGRGRWLTPFDIPALLNDARAALGDEVRLGGKRVSQ